MLGQLGGGVGKSESFTPICFVEELGKKQVLRNYGGWTSFLGRGKPRERRKKKKKEEMSGKKGGQAGFGSVRNKKGYGTSTGP